MPVDPGVLVHGYHLDAPDWEGVMWGTPPSRLGRLPRALLAFADLDARMMIVGSGASARGGRWEAEHAIDLLYERFAELRRFDAFQGVDLSQLATDLQDRLTPDSVARTTREEVWRAATAFSGLGCRGMTVVSSPFHAPRALRDAAATLAERGLTRLSNNLYAAVSDVDPPAATAAAVAVVEPPHRPDRAASDLSAAVSRAVALPDAQRRRLLARMDELLDQMTDPAA